jgi:hypothetical protein
MVVVLPTREMMIRDDIPVQAGQRRADAMVWVERKPAAEESGQGDGSST